MLREIGNVGPKFSTTFLDCDFAMDSAEPVFTLATECITTVVDTKNGFQSPRIVVACLACSVSHLRATPLL